MPLPAGPRSLVTTMGLVLQPSQVPDGCDSIVTGVLAFAAFSARIFSIMFQYCGPGPASVAAVKRPLARIATEVVRRYRVFMAVSFEVSCSTTLHRDCLISPSGTSALLGKTGAFLGSNLNPRLKQDGYGRIAHDSRPFMRGHRSPPGSNVAYSTSYQSRRVSGRLECPCLFGFENNV
jgi:hypothetical protein